MPGTQSAEFLPAAISVGTNPQFNGVERTVEAHVLGRSDLNLYGERIAVTFVSRIRPMLSFDSLDGLLTQMDDDLRQTASVLGIGVAGRVDHDSGPPEFSPCLGLENHAVAVCAGHHRLGGNGVEQQFHSGRRQQFGQCQCKDAG